MSELFGNDTNSKLSQSLNSKFFLNYNYVETPIMRAAKYRDVCAVERLNDINIIVNELYTTADGIPMVRAVPDCPRSYSIAYVVKKGWPFTFAFNQILSIFFESGLLGKWYKDTEHAIIAQNLIDKPVESTSTFKAYSLYDMQIGFYIAVFGLLFSILIFFTEIILNRFNRKNFVEN